MPSKNLYYHLNLVEECKSAGLPLWQCPAFLTVLTGFITLITMVTTYLIATQYTEPEIVALIVMGMTAILLIINYLIVHSFEKLAETNRLKTEFVSIASHQLRTPLTNIKWSLNALTDKGGEQLAKDQVELLTTISENNQRMIELVNDLLNVSRIDQGTLTLKPKKMSLAELIKESLESYEPLAAASNTEISLNFRKDTPLISADDKAIKLIIDNLIDNAIRYTPGRGKVKIKLIKKGKYIRCEVKDNGVGIPADDQKKIFQKFFRSQNVMKYQTEGTGLGLFIAKSIIDMTKGKIGLQSQEGKGSTFWFELPIK